MHQRTLRNSGDLFKCNVKDLTSHYNFRDLFFLIQHQNLHFLYRSSTIVCTPLPKQKNETSHNYQVNQFKCRSRLNMLYPTSTMLPFFFQKTTGIIQSANSIRKAKIIPIALLCLISHLKLSSAFSSCLIVNIFLKFAINLLVHLKTFFL